MQCATVCLFFPGLRTDQRLQSPVCSCKNHCFLSSRPFWFFWSFWALIIYLYSLSRCHQTLLGLFSCFGGRPSVCSSRLARNLTSTEYQDFKIWWQACSATPTFPADLTQPISNPPRTQSKSTPPGLTSHSESTTPRSPQRGVSPIYHSGTALLKVQAAQIFVEGQSQA